MSRSPHARQSRFCSDRSRSAGLPLRHDRGSRAAGEATSSMRSDLKGIRRPPAATACISTSRSSPNTPTTRAARSPRSCAHLCSATGPSCSRRRDPFQSAEGPRLFRLGAERKIENNRRALRPARICRRAGSHAARMERSTARARTHAVQYLECARTLSRRRAICFAAVLTNLQELEGPLQKLEGLLKRQS